MPEKKVYEQIESSFSKAWWELYESSSKNWTKKIGRLCSC